MNHLGKSIVTIILVLLALSIVGCTGEQGSQGLPGLIGPQGEQGLQGEQGIAGSQGEPGLLATTGEVTFTIPRYVLSNPGSIVIEVNHNLEDVELPPYVSLGLVSEYGIIIGNDFIFGFQNYLKQIIAGQVGSLPKVAFTVFDITPETFKIAAMCTEEQPTTITIRWWAIPAQ